MCKKLIYLSSVVLFLVMSASVFAQTYPGKIGVGVSMGWTLPFVDAAKTTRQFDAIGGGLAPTDSNGWPTTDGFTCLWDMRPYKAWGGEIDDPEQFTPNMVGTYKCSFNGQATLAILSGDASLANQSYDSGLNTTSFDLIVHSSDPWTNVVVVEFTNTKRTSSSSTNTGLTNLKAIRPGYPADTTQIFHTPFIDCLQSASFSFWRANPWVLIDRWADLRTFYPQQIEWADRKQWTDITQNRWGNGRNGACWETVIWLSNQVNMDPWINVPVCASDDYVTQLATLFRDNLNSNLNIYVESSNEIWNWGFPQSGYNSDWATDIGLSWDENHAKRTVDVTNIFANVWGASEINDRVRVVHCWQFVIPSQFAYQMQYINANYGPPNQYIWGLGCAPYHHCSPMCTTGTAQEILDAMWDNSNTSVVKRQELVAIANNWNLPGGLLTYEAGSDTGGGDVNNIANKLAAERAPGMKDVMIHDVRDNWFPKGGGYFCYLTLASGYSRFGSWGLTDDITDPDRNYKFAAVRDLLGDVPGAPGLAHSPNPSDGATDVSADADLSWGTGASTTSHDVYFGTDPTPDSGEFQGNQAGVTFDPGTMATGTTYYWRIDEVGAGGTTTGSIWSFTIPSPPGQASNPNPADDATAVLTSTSLSWTAGSDATNRDVYFGTTSPGTFQGNQTGAIFDPGTLSQVTTYYWRIDELNATGTNTGVVWSFTTGTAGATGTILREYWTGIGGQLVSNLTSSPDYPDNPSGSSQPTSFEAPINWADDYGTRMRGYLYPPTTGDYTFWIASDNYSELWLSTDNNPNNVSEIADVPGYTGSRIWDKYTEQQSSPISLTGGNIYYIEALHKAGGGGDHVAVAWQGPGISQAVIDGSYLSPWTGGGPQPPGQATNPSPADGATDVSTTADLSWTAGSGATSHDVYFGATSPGTFQGNQAGTTYDPGTMANDMTYYWRINEVGDGGTTTGNIWSFTTPQSPNAPANLAATPGDGQVDLDWDNSAGAVNYNVYRGTGGNYYLEASPTSSSWTDTSVINGTTYYYYVTAENAIGESGPSNTVSATPQAAPLPPGQATNPSPADATTNVSVTADLSWTAGADATSHDVYFGATSPGDFQGNQAGTTFDPGVMIEMTNYYWRIDEKNAYGTTTGVIWSFVTTPAPGPGTGLQGDYYNNTDFTSFVLSRVDANVDFTWGSGSPDPNVDPDSFSVRWTGFVEPIYSETYTFYTVSDDGVRLWVNGQSIVDNWTLHGETEDSGTIALTAGTQYDIQMDYFENGGNATAQLLWSSASQTKEIIPQSQLYEPNAPPPPPPGQATNPSPADAATDVSVDSDLDWTAGSGASSHDVYFGTTSPGTFQGNQAGTTFDPCTMAYDTTYYWCIDEVSAGGTTTGVVWSFTTGTAPAPPGQAANPSPADSATDVSTTADLSWTAGSGATSHDVYFGTTSPGEFQGNQAGTIFDPGTMTYNTTYYWRIDEKNAQGTTTGVVWSFTTIPGGATGTILREYWTGVSGALVSELTSIPDYPDNPSGSDEPTSFEAPSNWADNYGTRMRGYIYPPTTGDYTFWIASDNGSELWLSTDDDPNNASKIADVPGWTRPNIWDKYPEQQSSSIPLTGGNVYYIEALHKEHGGNDHVAVSWQGPGISQTVIDGVYLSPWTGGAPQPPGQAANPNPADSASAVDIDADLSWTAGSGATSHDVYFGTVTSPPFVQNQAGTTYDPGTMSEGTTHYWRIDEVGAGGTTTGVVWSFTTESAPQPPGQATNPNPGDDATGVSVDADLSWTAGSGATSHDVYFGTTSPGTFQGNQGGTTFDPCTMATGTTYYWRIDEKNAGGTTTGVVWSFTTAAGATGTILREYWTGISGVYVFELTSSPDYPDNPSGSNEPTSFEGPTNWADNYGTRMRGYIYPPTTGDYTFWIASDDRSQLWLSTDDDPNNVSQIAYVPGYTSSKTWDKYPEQQSSSISLTGGNVYYIEALHKEGGSNDHVAVAWQGPGISQAVIDGAYLSPWTE